MGLASQAADQLDGLVWKSRAARPPVRVGPPLLHERTVPPEDRLWGDEERLPAFPRDKTSKQSDERSVAPGEAECPGDLAAKHGQLVAQDEDLGIFRRGIRPVDTKELEHAPNQTVDEGPGPRRASPAGRVVPGQTGSGGFWILQARNSGPMWILTRFSAARLDSGRRPRPGEIAFF